MNALGMLFVFSNIIGLLLFGVHNYLWFTKRPAARFWVISLALVTAFLGQGLMLCYWLVPV